MTETPRLLVVLGSGETSPTMVTSHQRVFGRLGADVAAVCLDSPYGFQENADELTARITDYFASSVGRRVEPVRFRSREEAERAPEAHAEQLARLAAARWVFAGPGSPSYALRTWTGSAVPTTLEALLAPGGAGGAVVFASAAALTLGVVTVPVYEIYKVGETPFWLPGLDLLGRLTGLRAAVIPHFDNAEGGTHDTRYSYLGERRLRALESELDDDTVVLGVDEHTGVVLDLEAREAEVVGRGVLTIRRRAHAHVVPAGERVGFDDIAEHAAPGPRTEWPAEPGLAPPADTTTIEHLASFDACLAADLPESAGRSLVALEAAASTPAERELVRAAVMRLASYAADAPVDRFAEVGPYVDLLLRLRADARVAGRYAEADAVRDALVALGVAVRDGPDGTAWALT